MSPTPPGSGCRFWLQLGGPSTAAAWMGPQAPCAGTQTPQQAGVRCSSAGATASAATTLGGGSAASQLVQPQATEVHEPRPDAAAGPKEAASAAQPRVANGASGRASSPAPVVAVTPVPLPAAPSAPPAVAATMTCAQPPLKGLATCELCCFCFQVLQAHLQSQPPPPFPTVADPAFRAPIFVTWLKKRRRSDRGQGGELELRGCIGCLEPVVLRPGLSEYALRSSLQDRRFAPVQLDEVPSLTCKLSILYQFEMCGHIHDWEVGLHGVLINFADSKGRQYSATYLPEVARDHGMTHEVAIRELVAKAGYVGPCDQDLLKGIEVTRYKTLVDSVAYRDHFGTSRLG